MGIPAHQLQTWSALPDAAPSARTYDRVRGVLLGPGLSAYEPEVFLQGSYANHTNVRSDSDVDLVALLRASWQRDLSFLDAAEQARYHGSYSTSAVTLEAFRKDVLTVLQAEFPGAVTEGKKCLKIAKAYNRLPADVLVAQEYRVYQSFPAYGAPRYIEGVRFTDRAGNTIINFPKRHRQRGEEKHAATRNSYKGVVRTVKNARAKARDDGLISTATSPSYFVECLLFNVPDEQFVANLRDSYFNVLTWLSQNFSTFEAMWCQNGMTKLFGPGDTQWNTADARALVNALVQQWNSW